MLEIPLERSFRYVHEPLRAASAAIPLLGNGDLAEALRDRVVHSQGGTFLISGFRGVGKSTIVLRALDSLAAMSDGAEVVVPVVLNVARAAETDRLLFAVVRRIFESLHDRGLLTRLPAESQRSLLLAYMRTSLAFKQTRSDAVERGASGEAGGGAAMKLVVPKISISGKRTRSLATEAQFLAYSETDVEHDIMRIVSLLDTENAAARPWRNFLRWWPRRQSRLLRVRLAVVLDEVDKLTSGQSGLAAVENLLGGIKNILTLSGIHFLVVAGPDLHDRVVRDVARGNSVYESVFGWRMYVPCSWAAVERLLDGVIAEGAGDDPEQAAFANYLRFKARGVPRRLLQEFNEFVIWGEDGPLVRVPPSDADRISFYARLESILRDYFDQRGRTGLFPIPIDEDRRRLGAYYVVDWVLRSEGEPFRATDLVREGVDAELDPMLRVSLGGTERLLKHLARNGIVNVLREPNANATMYGNAAESQQVVYRLADDIINELRRFAVHNESERAALDLEPTISTRGFTERIEPERLEYYFDSLTSLPGTGTRGARPPHVEAAPLLRAPEGGRSHGAGDVIGGRYELNSMLGQGGMGAVWRGRDRVLGRVVAVKVIGNYAMAIPDMVARFRREAELTSQVDHPHIVHCFDVIEFEHGLGMVLEFLDGVTLEQEITENGPMSPEAAARIALVLADALDYLEQKSIVRLDMKPGNVMMHPTRGPVIIDFGIARRLDTTAITQAGAVLGTPSYMAPEQAEGAHADHRSDIHAFGLLLYYCLTGTTPLRGERLTVLFHRLLSEEIDVSDLPVSAEFRIVIAKAVRRAPNERYQHAADLIKDLEQIPEAKDDGQEPPLPLPVGR